MISVTGWATLGTTAGVTRLLDIAAVWWLDRHCRAWQANRHATGPGPACYARIYRTETEPGG